jgi:hypothetical protein
MEDRTADAVAAFAAVVLSQRGSTFGSVVDIRQRPALNHAISADSLHFFKQSLDSAGYPSRQFRLSILSNGCLILRRPSFSGSPLVQRAAHGARPAAGAVTITARASGPPAPCSFRTKRLTLWYLPRKPWSSTRSCQMALALRPLLSGSSINSS